MIELGVNVDHVATLREARRGQEPDPVWASALAELGGADSITIHLREDRRHIQERDLRVLCETSTVRLNLELACADEVLRFAEQYSPDQATLVPENRQEITTEGGLDLTAQREQVRAAVKRLVDAGIFVSLFLDPEPEQIEAAATLGVDAIELHTGSYALAKGEQRDAELDRLRTAGRMICDSGMALHAGHGLNYQNVYEVAAIDRMRELNIGHSIVSRAVLVGMKLAVREMKDAMVAAVLKRS